ncbi:unnamed protein product [Arctogadus glacialis]
MDWDHRRDGPSASPDLEEAVIVYSERRRSPSRWQVTASPSQGEEPGWAGSAERQAPGLNSAGAVARGRWMKAVLEAGDAVCEAFLYRWQGFVLGPLQPPPPPSSSIPRPFQRDRQTLPL